MPKPKLKPIVITTREGMEAAITEYLSLRLRHQELTAQMEQDKLDVEKRYEQQINALGLEVERHFSGVQNYVQIHRRELMPGEKKSFATVNAEVAFELTPPAVGKTSRETFGAIAKRLLGLVFKRPADPGGEEVELDCARYVRDPEPELDKQALLADRKKFTPDELRAMGLKFEQEELFYIRPKSEVLEPKSAEAA